MSYCRECGVEPSGSGLGRARDSVDRGNDRPKLSFAAVKRGGPEFGVIIRNIAFCRSGRLFRCDGNGAGWLITVFHGAWDVLVDLRVCFVLDMQSFLGRTLVLVQICSGFLHIYRIALDY